MTHHDKVMQAIAEVAAACETANVEYRALANMPRNARCLTATDYASAWESRGLNTVRYFISDGVRCEGAPR